MSVGTERRLELMRFVRIGPDPSHRSQSRFLWLAGFQPRSFDQLGCHVLQDRLGVNVGRANLDLYLMQNKLEWDLIKQDSQKEMKDSIFRNLS